MNKTKYDESAYFDNIDGFEGYHVSKDGRVFSRRSFRKEKGKFSNFWREKKIIIDKIGRCNVSLRDSNGKVHNKRVHRLVLLAYVGKCPDGMECCHNDGNAGNNHLDNLRWDTSKSNKEDLRKHSRLAVGEKSGTSKLKTDEVIEIIRLRKNNVPIKDVAEKFKVNKSTISKITKGNRWKHLNV